MRWDFVVLGATGMQGKIVSKDLLENGYSVLMCGRDKSRVDHLLKKYKKTGFQYFDAENLNDISRIIEDSGASVVANCVEGDWDLQVLKACIKAGVHSIDLGSDIPMTKDQLALHPILKNKGLTHITGCGSVPGIGNVMLRYASQKFDKIDTVDVGFAWDSNIKKFVVPFSIGSILEEFTTYAPYMHNRKIVKVKPMDSAVVAYHRQIGREKEFKCGHHPEVLTFHRFCKNKGIKNIEFYAGFPEHSRSVIQAFIDSGFNSDKKINFKGMEVWPDEFLTEVLKKLKIPPGYKETENLWVTIQNKNKRVLMECIVPTLKGWEDAGCNIDTGMPASIMAQMIKKQVVQERGSFAPEDIIPPKPFFQELRKRDMAVYENGKRIN